MSDRSAADAAGLPVRAQALRQMRDLLRPLAARMPVAGGALDLLDRDLLPRSAGGDTCLVVGIVGPNNAGKSALFNALARRDLSPSLPAGGATRRLVGAAHPTLLARLQADPSLARFRLRPLADPGHPIDAALEPATDPAELLVVADTTLPIELMLIDTPDFDSIMDDNRLASESLLAVADLVVAVVTRHSYQNRAVVTFLEQWFAHQRPWMLVYNEAVDIDVARSHAIKLIADVGTPPLATFWAPHNLAVPRGAEPLDPQPLPLDGSDRSSSLRQLLFDGSEIAAVKSRAFSAAMARLDEAVFAVTAALTREAAQARAVLGAAEALALHAGTTIGAAAMPAGPFIAAFRAVLDRRTNPISRGWRTAIRQVRLGLERLPGLLTGRRPRSDDEGAVSLATIERAELRKLWPVFWEDLARDLGPEARHAARRDVGPPIAAALDADLADQRRAPALRDAERVLAELPAEVASFRSACETLVEQAIDERGFDLDIQAAADLSTLMPLAVAAVVIVHTAGLGSDIAAAGGGAVGTFLFEKYAHLLGGGIMATARRRWSELRGEQLAQALVERALPTAAPSLRAAAEQDTVLVEQLRQLHAQVSTGARRA